MPKVVNTEFKNDLSFILDYLVESETYEPWKQRLTNQLLSNLEVPGFRKGKVPLKVALQRINPQALESTLVQETVTKYYQDAVEEAKLVLEKEDRTLQNIEADFDQEFTKEVEGGFQFRIVLGLLPNIDLSILNKIKLPEPTESDLPKRISLEEFIEKEEVKFLNTFNDFQEIEGPVENGYRIVCDVIEGKPKSEEKNTLEDRLISLGMNEFPPEFEENLIGLNIGMVKEFSISLPIKGSTKNQNLSYTVNCKKVLKPQYNNIQDLLENSETAKKQFENQEKIREFLENYYNDETQLLKQDAFKRNVIKEVLDKIPQFSLPNEAVEAEQTRIYGSMEGQAIELGQPIGEILQMSAITQSDKILSDPIEVRKEVDRYVVREFRWKYILANIYHEKVQDKVNDKELDAAVSEMLKQPKQYNISENLPRDQVQEIAYNRILLNKAAEWMFSLIENNSKKEDNNIIDIEEKPKAKTTKTKSKE